MENKELIKKYRDHLIKQGLSPATIERKLSSVRIYLNFLGKKGYFEPEENLTKTTSIKESPFTNKEIRQRLSALGIKVPKAKTSFFSQLLIVKIFKKTINTISDIPKLRYSIPYFLKYSRPKWFIRYQKLSIIHSLNLIIFILLCVTLSFTGYKRFSIKEPEKIQEGQILGVTPSFPPVLLSYKGRLTDNNGNPINTPSNVKFMIYTDKIATGSANVYEETKEIMFNEDGTFSTLVGDVTPIDKAIFYENPGSLWMGMGCTPYTKNIF